MKPLNLEKILFPVNAIVTAVVFFLLAPTTRIYARWFPEKKDSMWWIPVWVLGISVVLWVATSLAMPYLIRKGVFEDRRKAARGDGPQPPVRLSKVFGAVSVFVFHMIILIALSLSLIVEMRKGGSERLFPGHNIVWRN